VECSGQGICNRQSGECECFDGFTGRACFRSACPNNCSGNGQCKLLSEVETTVAYSGTNWDANRIQSCVCDKGFFGSDCSQRMCPTGTDPLQTCDSTIKDMVQEVRFVLGSTSEYNYAAGPAGTFSAADVNAMALFGYDASNTQSNTEGRKGQLRLSYVDSWGGKWVASGVEALSTDDDAAQNDMAQKLLNLPNKKVNDVTVTSIRQDILKADRSGTWTAQVPQRVWQVTFKHDDFNSNNVGLQNTMQCDSGYSCTEAGCQPQVRMPFLYRYASTGFNAVGTDLSGLGAISSTITTYAGAITGHLDNAANWAGSVDSYKMVRLNADSQPQLPAGIAVDDMASRASPANFARYDMRILVAVVDGDLADGNDQVVDNYYTRVILGHTNIVSSDEAVGNANVWGNANTWTPSLNGFDFNGAIPSTYNKIPVAGAPGVFLNFPARNMVGDQKIQFFEILVKLPHCTVTPVLSDTDVYKLSGVGYVAAVDSEINNIECSGRGACNRKEGTCGCYEGYHGLACQSQTTLV
jgi:hypothetical protein